MTEQTIMVAWPAISTATGWLIKIHVEPLPRQQIGSQMGARFKLDQESIVWSANFRDSKFRV
jgi:hypothetical protein